ncbi:styrene monooxygenase/indole monooxygenase family protein [Streptomonospora wellingtoniae]|uniref:Styrene monooxygenase/indole monooxygenase family protein n=1 Tax=Streptomonospora wellingtoniae TaxID=3075544 RepID=A0ABU2KRN8_9ACTN|nr:styrene monooxygenase/indole monooxygenase family protein [Streptomonospora sp. DSM 45055]MDT0301951.1 styrene monooxygenase/indole monooxygenase family protein [Streptomonospora sp. DSM 45055]
MTMRRITIVGTGQAGLTLGNLLRNAGHQVRMTGSMTSTELRKGRPDLTQMSFPSTRRIEEEAGLYNRLDWLDAAPRLRGVDLSLRPGGDENMTIASDWSGGWGLSVDRSVKIADWLDRYEDDWGSTTIHAMTTGDLDYMLQTGMTELIVVATGDSQLGRVFPIDAEHTAGARRRAYAQAFVVGADHPGDRILAASLPEGEVYLIPVLTTAGPVTSVLIGARAGASALDCHENDERTVPDDQVWERMMLRLVQHVPDFAGLCKDAVLADVDGPATVLTHVDPVVRRPVGYLASDLPVLGMADAVLTSDPVSCQGWGNSTRSAHIIADEIAKRGDAPFDASWMQQVHDRFWHEAGRHAAAFSEMIDQFYAGTLPAHYLEVAGAATAYPEVGKRWNDAFDEPSDFANFLYSQDEARAYLADVAARS